MKFRAFKILFLFFLANLLFSGCATILGGRSNTLVFSEKNLIKAQVFIDGDLVGEAPGKIKLPKHKIQHGSVVIIKAEGFREKEYLILRKQNAVYSVTDLLLGGIPLAVDFTTGNIYRPVPRAFKYELIKE
jgi:hypothetical protein